MVTSDGKEGYELEILYEETDADISSTNPEELKKCLHAGKVPETYRGVISKMEVKEVRRKVAEESEEETGEKKTVYGTPEEMKRRAEEGYFVRDPERNLVYCPAGEILRQKCIKKNGNIRYANKNVCRTVRTGINVIKGKMNGRRSILQRTVWRKPCRDWLKLEGKTCDFQQKKTKGHYEKKKVVTFILKPDSQKTEKRMCLSEHPFGTIKRAMGAAYFLLRGLRKVTGEFALMCLGYNMERAKNLLGFGKMMRVVAVA